LFRRGLLDGVWRGARLDRFIGRPRGPAVIHEWLDLVVSYCHWRGGVGTANAFDVFGHAGTIPRRGDRTEERDLRRGPMIGLDPEFVRDSELPMKFASAIAVN